MRTACLLVCMSITLCLHAQIEDPGETPFPNSQFSYLLVGLDSNKTPVSSATGFFIRQNQKLFLVTCYHVLTSCQDTGDGIPRRFDVPAKFIAFHCKDKKDRIQRTVITPLCPFDTMPCLRINQRPDLDLLEVTNLCKQEEVNSIDAQSLNTLDSTADYAEKQNIFIWAYPQNTIKNTNDLDLIFATEAIARKGKILPMDDQDLLSKKHAPWYFLYTGQAIDGESGAPVFRIIRQSENVYTYALIGIQCSKVKGHASIAVRSDQIKRYLPTIK